MRTVGAAFELGVGLGADEIGMAGEFDHFDESVVGGDAGNDHAVLDKLFAKVIVDLVPVPMALGDSGGAVEFVGDAAVDHVAGP